MKNRYILLFISYIFLYLFLEASTPPKVVLGEIDLTKHNFQENSIVNLDGEWEFYWNKIYFPDYLNSIKSQKEYANFPLNGDYHWEKQAVTDFSPFGYATYKLKIKLQKSTNRLAISIPENMSAYELWINKKREAISGKIGKTLDEEKPRLFRKYVILDKGIEDLELVFIVSNFHYVKGGFENPISIGSVEQIITKQEKQMLFDAFSVAILFIIGIYHIILFLLHKRDKSALFLGLFCFALALRTCFNGFRLVLFVYEDFNWELSEKIQFLTAYILLPIYMAFIDSMFKSKISKLAIKILFVALTPITIVTVFFPARIYACYLNYFYIILAFTLITVIFLLIENTAKRSSKAFIILFGTLIFFITVVNDALNERGIIASLTLSNFGFIGFIVLQSFIVATNFSEAFYKTEKLSKELEDANASLEEKVSDRTKVLEEKTREAEAATKTKDQFLANISHEIRTPMNAILGFSSIALNTELSEKHYDYLKKIEVSATHLLSIINDILDFSKIEANKLEMEKIGFRLDTVIENVVNNITLMALEKKLALSYHIDQEIPKFLVGDSVRLGQILLNLANNAVKFTQNGSISVMAELVEKDKNSCTIEFLVKDTGIGITQEEILKLFKPFTQADNSITRIYGGTGLGLSISKKLVEMMNGTIRVKSEPKEGSEFIFTATFEVLEKYIEAQKEVQLELDELHGAKILLVEDNPINQELIIEILGTEGLEVDVANNGEKAISSIGTKKYDLVFMDIHMPVLSGIEATKIIRKDPKNDTLPIVAMSADAITGVKEECLKAGMNDYISKPIKRRELFFILKKWIKIGSNLTKIKVSNLLEEDIYVETEFPEDISGFNVSDGLERMDGNKALYKKLLISFYQKFTSSIEQIIILTNEGNSSESLDLLHSLKGVSSNLSANKITKTLSDLEKAIKNDKSLCDKYFKELNEEAIEFTKFLTDIKWI